MNAKRKLSKIVGISLSAAALAVGLTACGSKDSDGDKSAQTTEYTVKFETNGGSSINSKIVTSGSKVTKPADPTKDGFIFGGWLLNGQDFKFDTPITGNITLTAKWNTESFTINYEINDHGTQPASVNGTKLPDTLPALEAEGLEFGGWHLDAECNTAATAGAEITANTTLYAKWEKEKIKYAVNFEDLIAQGTADLTDSVKIGNVTFSKGITPAGDGTGVGDKDGNKYKRIKNIKGDAVIDGNKCTSLPTKQYLEIEIGGKGSATLYYAPGGTGDRNLYVINKDTMDVLYNIPNGGSSSATKLEVKVAEKTTIIVCASNGHNFYGVETAYEGSFGDEVGISITSNGDEKYLAGDKVDLSGLTVVANYSSGATKDLKKDAYNVELTDSSNQKLNLDNPLPAAGEYTLTVKYKEFEAKSFKINVYDLGRIELGFNKIEKLKNNTGAGNGQYFNQTVQQVYKLNDTLDKDALSIKAYSSDDSFAKLLDLNSAAVSFSQVDMSTAGEKEITVTVSLNGVTKSQAYKVYVVDTAIKTATENEQTTAYLYVDKNYDGVVGAVNNVAQVSKDCNTFKTIQQALDYLGMQDSSLSSARKMIYLAEGTYNEKIEITLPYVELFGLAGAEKTIIEWDSLVGLTDETGYGHTTDSTATVAIRDSALNCIIDGVTISNYYNNINKYTGNFASSGERGLAVLAQADKLIIQNSRLLGWQDTLELFTGRQYIKDTYICGAVDYIFGTNNATYFEGCTIETVKSKPSYTTDDKVSAYVTAFKGQNKNAGDAVTYGAIFDDCDFITSTDFVGKAAIARPWQSTSSVAYINSRFSNKFATTESEAIISGLIKDVNLASLKIKVYNNTLLDGETPFTITEDTLDKVSCNMTETEAANYTKANIFAQTNGGVTFTDAWNPEDVSIKVDNNIYYNFGGLTSPTGTVYTLNNPVGGAYESTLGGLTINTAKCQTYEAGYTEVQPGTMTLTVPAGANLLVKTGYGTNAYLTVNDLGLTAADFSHYYEEETVVTLNFTGKVYLLGIQVTPDAEKPAEATITSVVLEGTPNDEFVVGTALDLSGLKAKVTYSDNTYKYTTDFTTNAEEVVDTNTAGTYTVTVSVPGTTTPLQFDVRYVATASDSFDSDIVLDFSNGIAADTLNSPKITKSQDFAYNNSNDTQITAGTFSFKVKAGAHVDVEDYGGEYGNISVNGTSTHGVGHTIIDATEDMTIVIGIGDTDSKYSYIKKITITYQVSDSFDSNTELDFIEEPATTLSNSKITKSSDFAYNDNGNSTQITAGTFSFKVKAGAHVVIEDFGGEYGNITVNGEPTNGAGCTIDAEEDMTIVIGAVNAQNSYIKKITITYQVSDSFDSNTELDFIEEPATTLSNSKITKSSDFAYNDNGNSTQITAGTFSFKVKAGAHVDVEDFGDGQNGDISIKYGETTISTGSVGHTIIDAEEDMTIVIGVGNTGAQYSYLKKITITYQAAQ